MAKGLIYISKDKLTLTLYDASGNVVLSYPIACGRVIGQKQQKGDNRTPEGLFYLQMVQNASKWGHDFGDGNGFIKDAYGPWFMRLKTGFNGIGIHGTHAPESIGTRASEGCIRVENSNLENLRQYVKVGMSVIIGPEDGYLYADMPVKRVTPSTLDKPLLADAEPRRSDATRIEMTIDAPAMDLVESSTIMLKDDSFILAENVVPAEEPVAQVENESKEDEPFIVAENASETEVTIEAKIVPASDPVLARVEAPVLENEMPAENEEATPEESVIPEVALVSESVENVPVVETASADESVAVEEPLLSVSVPQAEEPKKIIIRKVKEGHVAMIDIHPDCQHLADLSRTAELRLAYVPKYIIFNNQ